MRAAVQSQRGGDTEFSSLKKKVRHDIPEEPARRDKTRVQFLCLDGLTDTHGFIIPFTKSAVFSDHKTY
jgi:hypothetical protein